MRSLSSGLLAAQRSRSALPHVKVEMVEKVAGVARLNWSRLYTGSEADFYHTVTMPQDGSLLRARVAIASYQLYLQRVVIPGPGSDFSQWTALGTVSDASGIALASRGSNVLLCYVGTDQQTIYARDSGDSGASFGDPVTVVTASAAVGWLAAAFNASGVAALFYSVGGTVYCVKRSGGTWGSPAAWSNSAASIAGLACVHQGDWNLAICGQDASDNRKLWSCVCGDGYSRSVGVWSALEEIERASADSDVELRCPSLGFPDVFRLFSVEKYTGSSAYSRIGWSRSLGSADFIDSLWQEPVPFDLEASYGAALAYGAGYAWLSTPSGVWRASLTPASVEVTGDVLELTLVAEPFAGSARVLLRNDDGRYGSLGSGSYAAIKQGSELRISPGYRTASGVEVSTGPALWLQGWEYLSQGSQASFVLRATDGWGLLAGWRARRQFTWGSGSKNIFQLLSFVLARAGLELSSFSNSNALVNQYPAFTISPGESGARAARRLLDMVPDALFFRGHYGYILNPQASDASVYSYGTDHALLHGRYIARSQEANRVQVFGQGVLAQSFAWGSIATSYDRLRQVHDLNLSSQAQAQARGDAELRQQELEATAGEIAVPANCGQELYDVIDITDQRAGLSQDKRRVSRLTLDYARGASPRYRHRIELGGV